MDAPLTTAVKNLGLPALAIDLLIDPQMDLLHDPFYEQLLRLCGTGIIGYTAASPACTEYSLLKLLPGGPKAIRTPTMLEGVPNLTPQEQQRLQDSATMLDRCVTPISVTYSAGGHGHLEQPSGAMSWSEPCTQDWIRASGCSLILLAACAFEWDIRKTWLFASSFHPLSEIAAVCTHGKQAHQSIAGVRDDHGVFLSRRSAAYPTALASAFASKISVLLTPTNVPICWNTIFDLVPQKQLFQNPQGFVDGGGLSSMPDWSKPPEHVHNLFRSVRDHWIPQILKNNWHKLITAHFLHKRTDPPFSDEIVNQFRSSLDSLLPLPSNLDWQVRDDQPLCLHALAALSNLMGDPDVHLFPSLIAGVSTGYQEDIPPSHVFAQKIEVQEPAAADLSIHLTNWKTAEDHPEITSELVAEEIEKGWLICFDGTVEDAQKRWPQGVAIGKLGVAISDTRPPRLVVDYTVCGTNPNCNIQEHQQLPSAKDVQRCYPLRHQSSELGALGLDAKSAHKLCVIKEDHRGLVGFSLNNKLYFYKVCPFGAKFSAFWWGRLGAFWTRLFHQIIYVAHALFLFVDDWLLVQRLDILPVTAALMTLFIQAFRLPISWRKAELDRQVNWIGWTLNFSTGIIKLQTSKRDKLLSLITDLLKRPKTSKKQIEKFVGLLLWVTQLFPVMRAFIHHLYADMYKAPATLFSVDPGYWLTTLACLSDSLHFTVRPVGTAIPVGGTLLSVRHQPVHSLEEVRNCRLSEKRIWLRILDPTSSKRSISPSSQRILNMYQEWLQHALPFISMNPKTVWNGEAAADACAHGNSCQVGGFLKVCKRRHALVQ